MIQQSADRVLYGLTVGILVSITILTTMFGGVADAPVSTPAVSNNTDVKRTDDGTRYIVEPTRLRQGCPGGRDCIPAIDDPGFETREQADWLADDDLVIALKIDGEARAYPLRILNVHEIVNDDINGRAIAVTYCPLCRSGLVFNRTVNGSILSFGVSGKLLNANLVMYDRQTETYWSQLNGTAIVGPMVPERLEIRPNTITTWGEWRVEHPETRVLSRETGIYPASTYGGNPYSSFADRERVGFGVSDVDPRLHSKTIVYGVTVGNTSRAYPEATVRDKNVINDVVGAVPVLVVEDQTTGGVKVFVREVNETPREFRIETNRLVDQQGTVWSYDGTAMEGPEAGTELERLNSHGIYWFAWSEFHPETDIYEASN